MADSVQLDSVYPSPALVSLAKYRRAAARAPTSEPLRDNDCLYTFKYSGKPASVDPEANATVFSHSANGSSSSIWVAHPSTQGRTKEHRFSVTETQAKEVEVVLIWDEDKQSWSIEPLDSHYSLKFDRTPASSSASRSGGGGGPPATPAVPTEDELHARAASFFTSAAPNPFTTFAYNPPALSAGSESQAQSQLQSQGQPRATTPPRPISAGSLASLLNPLSAASPSHPATFSASPRAAGRSGAAHAAAAAADVEDFGEIASAAAAVPRPRKRTASPPSVAAPSLRSSPPQPTRPQQSMTRSPATNATALQLPQKLAPANSPPRPHHSPPLHPRSSPPHPSFSSKIPASSSSSAAAAAAAAAARRRAQEEQLSRELEQRLNASDSSSDEDSADEWQPVAIDADEDDEDRRPGVAANKRKKIAALASSKRVPSAGAKQTKQDRPVVGATLSSVEPTTRRAPPVRGAPAVSATASGPVPPRSKAADLAKAGAAAIQRVAPNIDSDSEDSDSDDDDGDSSGSSDGGGGGAKVKRPSSRKGAKGHLGAQPPTRGVPSSISQQVNAQMARIRSSSSMGTATPPPSAPSSDYPRIRAAAAVQQQQQYARAASVGQPPRGATPASPQIRQSRPSAPPPRNSDEARQLAERQADIPDSSEED